MRSIFENVFWFDNNGDLRAPKEDMDYAILDDVLYGDGDGEVRIDDQTACEDEKQPARATAL